VPVDTNGSWQPERIDLDSSGEIVRLGSSRPLLEGSFFGGVEQKHVSVSERGQIS
jgi:hypothetical protein